VKALAASKYSDVLKAQAWLDAASAYSAPTMGKKATAKELQAAEDCLDELIKLLPSLAKTTESVHRARVYEIVDHCQIVGGKVGRRKEWFDRIEKDALAKLPKDNPVPHLAAGAFLVNYAWDARGIGLANTVTEEGWKLFKERLTEAEVRLTRAWELDNGCALAAAIMVTVCKGLGHPRKTMETWFQRTVEADPTHTGVFLLKLDYLQPKWHGSPDEALEFARQVAKQDRWDTTLPLLLPLTHRELAVFTRNPQGYLKQEKVWAEIDQVLEALRKREPTSALAASNYLYFASLTARRGPEAHAFVEATVVDLPLSHFPNRDALDNALKWAKLAAFLNDAK
jgi:hypothetical protein